jgi:phenylalanine-4-hydroxylase
MAAAERVNEIPGYLAPYIARQEYDKYTPIDHASWRYILRVAGAFFGEHAHSTYLQGLEQTGISTDRIPRLEEMNACLGRFGWQAVAVSGFIPPQVFMEFQSLGIMPIACDMRKLANISYTPAPDIVHEAAGHAPMVADRTTASTCATTARSAARPFSAGRTSSSTTPSASSAR